MQAQKNLGRFYTPRRVAQCLTDWAVVDGNSIVLDPSYGGCSFLYAAQETLKRKGGNKAERQIFGVDIDPTARGYLEDLIKAGAAPGQYLKKDFFAVSPEDFNGKLFDSVVGNPPYVRYHDIPERIQKRAKKRLKEIGIEVSGRASCWVFFLLYSMHFLRDGGRLAMILPGALLHTDYAAQVRELLAQRFEEINIYLLQERIFDNTEEESVFVCADGAGRPHKKIRIGYVSTIEELENALKDQRRYGQQPSNTTGDGGWLRALAASDVLSIYDELIHDSNVIRLGDWANVRIGAVTGNNNYFILSEQERELRKIPEEYFIPVIRRPAYLTGLTLKEEDLGWLKSQGKKYLLLMPHGKLSEMPASLRRYIQEGKKAGVHLAQKCQARTPWYVVPQAFKPNALMACMAASWPRLVINETSYSCTNNILRISWKEERQSQDWLRVSLGTLSTLSQLSAELVGRSYGGGVLKLEPSELVRLAVPLVPIDGLQSLAKKVDSLVRQNNLSAATAAVDAALLNTNAKLSAAKLKQLRSTCNKLFFRRRQHRQDAAKIIPVNEADTQKLFAD